MEHIPSYPLYIGKYDYDNPTDDLELSFKKGDLMYIINSDEGVWWFAHLKGSGKEGYIPSNYVVKYKSLDLTLKDPMDIYVGINDYNSTANDDLAFKKGDLMYIISSDKGDYWWFARSKDSEKEGYIPSNYVVQYKNLNAEE